MERPPPGVAPAAQAGPGAHARAAAHLPGGDPACPAGQSLNVSTAGCSLRGFAGGPHKQGYLGLIQRFCGFGFFEALFLKV